MKYTKRGRFWEIRRNIQENLGVPIEIASILASIFFSIYSTFLLSLGSDNDETCDIEDVSKLVVSIYIILVISIGNDILPITIFRKRQSKYMMILRNICFLAKIILFSSYMILSIIGSSVLFSSCANHEDYKYYALFFIYFWTYHFVTIGTIILLYILFWCISCVLYKWAKEREELNKKKKEIEERKKKEDDLENGSNERELSTCKLIYFSILFGLTYACVFLCWAAQNGQVTPYFESIGIDERVISVNFMLAGPLSGLIVQPIVGYLSDTIYLPVIGRRRIYMLVGVIFIAFSLTFFSNSFMFSLFLEDENSNFLSQSVASLSFFSLDFAANSLKVAGKSLIVDTIPSKHQLIVMSVVFGIWSSIGTMVGHGLGSIPWKKVFPFVAYDIQVLFLIISVIIVICVIITLLGIREKKELEFGNLGKSLTKSTFRCCNGVIICFGIFFQLPCLFYTMFLVQFMSFSSLYIKNLYLSSFFGKVVFEGDPTSDLSSTSYEDFNTGVKYANLGFMLLAIGSIIYAPILFFSSRYVSLKYLWGVSQFVLGICMFVFSFLNDKNYLSLLLLNFFFLGICNCTIHVVPWSILNIITRDDRKLMRHRGLVSALFNASQCLPEIFIALFGGVVISTLENNELPMSFVFIFAGIFAWMSLIFLYFVEIPDGFSLV